MKRIKRFLASVLSLQMALIPLLGLVTVVKSNVYSQQEARTALMRGYRTGYSDGYMAGYKDSVEKKARGFQNQREYQKADRAYMQSYGTPEDYRNGYQQGFEKGYGAGFARSGFDSAIPNNLARRNPTDNQTPENTASSTIPASNNQASTQPTYANISDRVIIIPAETELIVKLVSGLSTDQTQIGDRFQVQVISPIELEGAIIEGKITDVEKPGRISHRAKIQLSFDQIRISETRWANYSAALAEVLPMAGNNVKDVDIEGGVRGKSSVKTDTITVGATAGTGAVIGAVAGGPVGAAVGAAVGGAFGVGTIIVSRGKQIKLAKDQQLRLRTSYETQIR